MALLFGASVAAQAAGLGKLTVNSSLGQPLNAEIDLVSLQPGELDNLSARVAPPEAFRDARIEYGAALRLLRFSIEKRQNGSAYLKVTSVGPINEPFLDVLVEVTWAAGRVQREYPILLDPPGYAQGRVTPPAGAATPPPREAPQTAATPPASAPAASSSAPASPAASSPATTSTPPAATAGTGTPSARAELVAEPGRGTQASGDTYGPVQKGETLRKIAEEVKPSNVSLEQMLVALYRENQAAFAGNNMNRLKAGQILKVPSGEQVSQITTADANKEYRTQVADWRSYREQLAGGVAAIPARPETSTAASGRVTTAAVTPPAPPAAESKEVLKLSKSDAGKGTGAAGKGANQDRINALQEEVTAKDKALREANSRVSDLEKQIRDMQRLMDLKAGAPGKPGDAKVAVAPVPPAAPGKTEPAKPAAATPPPAPTPAPTPAPAATKPGEPAKVEVTKPGEAPKPADTKLADATRTDPSKPSPDAAKVDPAKAGEPPKVVADASKPADAAKPAPPKTDAKAPPKPAAPKKPAPDESLMDNPWVLAAAGGGLLALGLGAFMFMRRRREAADAGPSSAMTSAFPSDLKPGTGAAKPGGGLVDTGNSSFLTDFDKTGPGTIDTDEVDPVAEAEVYIAYGRDAQAEEILKEAMARDKGRTEIPLKLLEIYHARKSATAFETVAKELKANVGEGSPQWQKAAAMGAQIDPNNPLYGGAAAASSFTSSAPAAPAAKPDVDFDLAGSSTSSDATAPAPDFDLDLDGKSATTSQPVSSSGMDFDLSSSSAPAPAPEASKEEKPASFDFDLSGLDFPSTKNTSDLDVDAGKPASSGNIDLADLSLDGDAGGGGGEAVGTKLELAKAYLEIGDKDGAREILQEVAKEGSAAQREEAQRLIGSL